MSITLSTGLKTALLVETNFFSLFQGGVIRIYGGERPISPSLVSPTPHIGEITQDGNVWYPTPNNAAGGLQLDFDTADDGSLVSSGDWVLKGSTSGVAIWWRWFGPWEDNGATSLYHARIDGECGVDLILPSYNITPSYTQRLEQVVIQF